MTDKRARAKGRRNGGRFMAVPHSILNHQNFIGLAKYTKLIFFYLKSQYNGKNNGDLHVTLKTIKEAGFGSSSTQLWKALNELESKDFIFKTRQGGKNKCNLYALTCEAIDDCRGKHDFKASSVATNEWRKIKS